MDRTTQTQAWINLALVPGLGPKFFQRLASSTWTPSDLYQLESQQLKELGVNEKTIQYLLKHPPSAPAKAVEQALTWAQQSNHHLITPEDESFPEQLGEIASVPPLLFIKGRLEALKMPQIAMVGSRYPTTQGQQQAYEFAQGLSEQGWVVTSGLAKGVDALAHQGVVDNQGTTIAVLGTGIDKIYPKAHARLADAICEQGALVSEFQLGAAAMKGHFPRRNRIVSGLSLGVLVVEATLKSGSLITARQALEQNREVMALPGAIHNPQKAGCHFLIRQGAKLIESVDQITEELHGMIQVKPTQTAEKQNPKLNNAQSNLQGDQLKVFSVLDYDGIDMESLINKTRLDVSTLTMVLMEMELAGLLNQEQGMYMRSQ